jgi:hypothetical protein
MWALVVEQTPQRCWALLHAVWAKLGSQRLLWERMRALCEDYALASMRHLLAALLYGVEKPRPSLALHASYARARFLLRPRSIASSPPHRGHSMPPSPEGLVCHKLSWDS